MGFEGGLNTVAGEDSGGGGGRSGERENITMVEVKVEAKGI